MAMIGQTKRNYKKPGPANTPPRGAVAGTAGRKAAAKSVPIKRGSK
jgi:hypothetical protein